VGLPCHINGLRKAELLNKDLKNRIKLHIGIFCGTTKNFLATEFLLEKLGVKKEDVKSLNYRGGGWPGNLFIELKNGGNITIPYNEYYNHEFCSFTPWALFRFCGDHTSELADISFGDAWLPLYSDDKLGRSIIIARNDVGEDILESLRNNGLIEIEEISLKELSDSQSNYYLKKGRLDSRLKLARSFRKAVPTDNLYYPDSKSMDYLLSIWFYFWLYVSKKNHLHFLFNLQQIVVKILESRSR